MRHCFVRVHGVTKMPARSSTTEMGQIHRQNDECSRSTRSQNSAVVFLSLLLLQYAPLQDLSGSWRLRHKWPGKQTQHTGDSPQGSCGAMQCDGFTGWQRSHQWGGGSVTGTLASRCRLSDNATLINFLYFCHNDWRQRSHDKMESWIKKKIGRGWRCQEELWAAILLYNVCCTTVKEIGPLTLESQSPQTLWKELVKIINRWYMSSTIIMGKRENHVLLLRTQRLYLSAYIWK